MTNIHWFMDGSNVSPSISCITYWPMSICTGAVGWLQCGLFLIKSAKKSTYGFLRRCLCRQRAFLLEQSREQYLLFFLTIARVPFGPLSHLNHAQSVDGEPAKEDFPELPPGGFISSSSGESGLGCTNCIDLVLESIRTIDSGALGTVRLLSSSACASALARLFTSSCPDSLPTRTSFCTPSTLRYSYCVPAYGGALADSASALTGGSGAGAGGASRGSASNPGRNESVARLRLHSTFL